ncbi:hypothetical protein ACA910_022575 [Epithemia clementina (nom. ined.)]
MTSSAAQARAQQLNAKLEEAARATLDEIDKKHVRKIARSAYACVVACYDNAGTSGSSETLDQCARSCNVPHQQANNLLQSEVNQFQNRLNRSMQECQDKVRDMMKPGDEKNVKKMQQVEDALIACISKTVDNHISLLKPMQQRIVGQLKK